MADPIRIDMTADQLAGIKENLLATLTTDHLDELCALRIRAKDYAGEFSEAIKAIAEKCGISRSALRRYVCARVDDKLEALDTEASDLSHLLETAQ